MHVNLSYRLWLGSFALREFRPWNLLEIGPNFKEEPGRKCLFRWEDAKETESLSEKHLAPELWDQWDAGGFFSQIAIENIRSPQILLQERELQKRNVIQSGFQPQTQDDIVLMTMLRNICSIMLKTLLWLHLYQNSKKKSWQGRATLVLWKC